MLEINCQNLLDLVYHLHDYIMTGKEPEFTIEMAQTDVALSNMSERIKIYALKLAELDKTKQDAIFALIDSYEGKEE